MTYGYFISHTTCMIRIRKFRSLPEWQGRYKPDFFVENDYVSYNGIVMNASDFGNLNYGFSGAFIDSNSDFLVLGGNFAAMLSYFSNDVFKIYHPYTGGDDMKDVLMILYGRYLYNGQFR